MNGRRLVAGDVVTLTGRRFTGGAALWLAAPEGTGDATGGAGGEALVRARLEWRDRAGVWRRGPAPPPARRATLAVDAAAAPLGMRAARVVLEGPALLRRRRRFLSRAALARALAGDPAAFVLGGAPRRLPWSPRPARARLGAALARIWAMADDAAPAMDADADAASANRAPALSLLTPVFDADPAWLDALVRSVRDQATGVLELILADDGSSRAATRAWLDAHATAPDLRVLRLGRNVGVAGATNAALAAARGRWVAMIDHDDLLAPHAAARVVGALTASPGALFLYTDEVRVDDALAPISAYCKPAFDPVLLSGMNYVNHLAVYDRARLVGLGGLAAGFDGAQDYELALRYCRDLAPTQTLHLPYPAYLWRAGAESFSTARLAEATAAARRALARHLARPDAPVAVAPAPAAPHLHRVRWRRDDASLPSVAAIVPNRDSPALIAAALEGLLARTDYPRLSVTVVDNGTTDPAALAVYDRRAADPRVAIDIRPAPFNFSAMVNRGAALAAARDPAAHLLLVNNDVTPEDPGWLREMVDCLGYRGAGVVGARLLFPDRRIQHAGVILGQSGLAGHWFYKQPETTPGPMGRLTLRGGMTVVTGACLLTTRACWDATDGFDAARFPVAYNDVDFCFRARRAGFGVIWTPFATLIHHESASRGSDRLRRNRARFLSDQAMLRDRCGTEAFEDPAHSPLWSRFRSRPRVNAPVALPAARPGMTAPPSAPHDR